MPLDKSQEDRALAQTWQEELCTSLPTIHAVCLPDSYLLVGLPIRRCCIQLAGCALTNSWSDTRMHMLLRAHTHTAVHFSLPFYDSGFVLVVPMPVRAPNPWSFFQVRPSPKKFAERARKLGVNGSLGCPNVSSHMVEKSGSSACALLPLDNQISVCLCPCRCLVEHLCIPLFVCRACSHSTSPCGWPWSWRW